MKKMAFQQVLFLFLILSAIGITGCRSDRFIEVTNRERNFNEGWKFLRDSLPSGPEQPGFDDANWMAVDLPHDWSIMDLPGNDNEEQMGPFSKKSPGNTATGYVIGGTAWYRKHFKIDKSDEGKQVILRFDGVYMESEVWVNGKKAGSHVYGYTPFYYDITSLLAKPGNDNVVAVKVSNTGRNSRWYSGSGIYRNVSLTLVNPVHVAVWGVQVTSSDITEASAQTKIRVTLWNKLSEDFKGKIKIRILAPGGADARNSEEDILVTSNEQTIFTSSFVIDQPKRWSPDTPDLYQAIITVENKGKITDQYSQWFGIRSIEVSAEKGFLLNGKPLELKGGCMHHDNGLLGSAAFNRAEERRVQIMKDNGFNAIRTSHNPPSEAFLNACDRIGMLVIDEAFDMWQRPKNQQDYHRFFDDWWKKDLESMIMRDRNHPSIIMWSIGNEISERADSSGLNIAENLIGYIKQFDTTRPFTNAICDFWDQPGILWKKTEAAFALLTVGGYNYQYLRYEDDHGKFPERIMMGTESVPKDAFENWQQVIKNSYVIGDFVWTGMDYLGETGIGHTQYLEKDQKDQFAMTWPWFNAWCGDIDITGEKKPQMLYRDVIWGNSNLEMNVHAPMPQGKAEVVSYWGWPDEYPHWNWNGNEDKILQVSAYTKGDAVRLFLNGRELGYKQVSDSTKLKAVFDVPYEPGELKAVAYKSNHEIASKVYKTTGEAAGIRLIADRDVITANRNDLSFIKIEIIDEFGQVVSDAGNTVKISIKGNGELTASGNACPYDMKSFGRTEFSTYQGKALVVVRPFAKSGEIKVTAESIGLKSAEMVIKVE